jgi:glycerophosphoryl diester phosphodiesterase
LQAGNDRGPSGIEDCGVPAIYAHRLGRAYGPDSSRQALRSSLRGGLDGLETDCCLTADGEIVLLHDPLLVLATTASGWAHERTAAQILASRLRDRDGEPTSERPMLLDELLELAPADLTLQLEIKAHGDPALAQRTARAVCQRLAEHQSLPSCEILSFWSGACELAADLGFPARLVMIAEYRIDALCTWAMRFGLHGICIEHFLLSPPLIASLRQAGLSVTTGTINHPQMVAPLLPLSLDAITSDCPHQLRAALAELPIAARGDTNPAAPYHRQFLADRGHNQARMSGRRGLAHHQG